MRKVAFRNCESVISANIRVVNFFGHDYIGGIEAGASFNVIMARLFNLSYPDFLRMCRDTYGAVLKGKKGFTYIMFYDTKKCDALVKELNKRWDLMVIKRKAAGYESKGW